MCKNPTGIVSTRKVDAMPLTVTTNVGQCIDRCIVLMAQKVPMNPAHCRSLNVSVKTLDLLHYITERSVTDFLFLRLPHGFTNKYLFAT